MGCSAWPDGCPRNRLTELLARVVVDAVLVVVEGVNDQENLGAIFRNAAAFGAGAVFLDPTCADPLYRRTRPGLARPRAEGPVRPSGTLAGVAQSVAGRRVHIARPHALAGGGERREVSSQLEGARWRSSLGPKGLALAPPPLGCAGQVRVPWLPGSTRSMSPRPRRWRCTVSPRSTKARTGRNARPVKGAIVKGPAQRGSPVRTVLGPLASRQDLTSIRRLRSPAVRPWQRRATQT